MWERSSDIERRRLGQTPCDRPQVPVFKFLSCKAVVRGADVAARCDAGEICWCCPNFDTSTSLGVGVSCGFLAFLWRVVIFVVVRVSRTNRAGETSDSDRPVDCSSTTNLLIQQRVGTRSIPWTSHPAERGQFLVAKKLI